MKWEGVAVYYHTRTAVSGAPRVSRPRPEQKRAKSAISPKAKGNKKKDGFHKPHETAGTNLASRASSSLKVMCLLLPAQTSCGHIFVMMCGPSHQGRCFFIVLMKHSHPHQYIVSTIAWPMQHSLQHQFRHHQPKDPFSIVVWCSEKYIWGHQFIGGLVECSVLCRILLDHVSLCH